MKSLKSWCEEHGQEGLLRRYLEAGNPLPPESVNCSSDHPVRGESGPGRPPYKRYRRGDGCPFCSGRRTSPESAPPGGRAS